MSKKQKCSTSTLNIANKHEENYPACDMYLFTKSLMENENKKILLDWSSIIIRKNKGSKATKNQKNIDLLIEDIKEERFNNIYQAVDGILEFFQRNGLVRSDLLKQLDELITNSEFCRKLVSLSQESEEFDW